MSETDPSTMFDRVGGAQFFVDLVDRFYSGVAADPLLRPMYPDDLTDSKAHLAGFLMQYWGGPTTYSDERGHPRLRMRHAPFIISAPERNSWYRHMEDAVRAAELSAADTAQFLDYFDMAATQMINTTRP